MNRSTSRTTTHAFAAAAFVLLLGLSGCGDDTEPTASDPASGETSTDASVPTEATTSPATTAPTAPETTKPPVVLPDCEEVWAGDTLPFGYRGCMEGDTVVEAGAYPCSSGGRLIAYRNHYAIAGRVINTTDGPATDDRAYGRAIQGCSA